MSFKDFLVFEVVLIVSAIIFMWMYRATGIYKLFESWKLKRWVLPVFIVAASILTSGVCSVVIRIFSISKYEYILRGIFMGLIISCVIYLVPGKGKEKIKS